MTTRLSLAIQEHFESLAPSERKLASLRSALLGALSPVVDRVADSPVTVVGVAS